MDLGFEAGMLWFKGQPIVRGLSPEGPWLGTATLAVLQ
jgi:hypothetical protein